MKSQKAHRGSRPPSLGKHKGEQPNHNRKREIVERVMEAGEPQQGMRGIPRKNFSHDSEPIDIGHNR
jgi:hypothetical protein